MQKLFSLICITYNRLDVERFLHALLNQGTTDFEVILVDQNNDSRLDNIVAECSKTYSITHIKVDHFHNTSKARNTGLAKATGKWISFPDDDCWFSEGFLGKLTASIARYPGHGAFFVNWVDPLKNPKQIMFPLTEGEMTKTEVFEYSSAICVFMSHAALEKFGGWNEKLGVGISNVALAGDDQELFMRHHGNGLSFLKLPELEVYHPIGHRQWNAYLEKRILGSGATDFYLKRKYFGFTTAWKTVIRWIGGLIYNLVRFRKTNLKWYYLKLKGAILLSGKIAYEPAKNH